MAANQSLPALPPDQALVFEFFSWLTYSLWIETGLETRDSLSTLEHYLEGNHEKFLLALRLEPSLETRDSPPNLRLYRVESITGYHAYYSSWYLYEFHHETYAFTVKLASALPKLNFDPLMSVALAFKRAFARLPYERPHAPSDWSTTWRKAHLLFEMVGNAFGGSCPTFLTIDHERAKSGYLDDGTGTPIDHNDEPRAEPPIKGLGWLDHYNVTNIYADSERSRFSEEEITTLLLDLHQSPSSDPACNPPINPESAAVTESASGERPTAKRPTPAEKAGSEPLTLDDRAVALLNSWHKTGRGKISKSAVAKALGCHHSSLRDCKSFLRLWEMHKRMPKRGYRDARTGHIEAADDD